MRNLQDTVETRKQSFISTFSICMNAPLIDRETKQLCKVSLLTGKPLLTQIKMFHIRIYNISVPILRRKTAVLESILNKAAEHLETDSKSHILQQLNENSRNAYDENCFEIIEHA